MSKPNSILIVETIIETEERGVLRPSVDVQEYAARPKELKEMT